MCVFLTRKSHSGEGWGGWNRGWGWGGSPVFVNSFSPAWGWDPCWNGSFVGINGTADDANAPAVSLNLAVARNPVVLNQPLPDQPDIPGTFRYDGGPANPVPQPKPDANPQTQTVPAATGLPVSLMKETKPTSPYKYKAYGEK